LQNDEEAIEGLKHLFKLSPNKSDNYDYRSAA